MRFKHTRSTGRHGFIGRHARKAQAYQRSPEGESASRFLTQLHESERTRPVGAGMAMRAPVAPSERAASMRPAPVAAIPSLPYDRAPQAGPEIPLPVHLYQDEQVTETLTVKVPATLDEAFADITRQFDDLESKMHFLVQGHHAAVFRRSAWMQQRIGGPVRFTGPAGEVARIQAAYDEGGTTEAVGMVDELRALILERSLAGGASA